MLVNKYTCLFILAFGLVQNVQAQYSPEKNKAQLYKGTADEKYADACIHFQFTGNMQDLLNNLGKAHKTRLEEVQEFEGVRYYRALMLAYPNWVYGHLNIYVEVDERSRNPVVRIHHTYYKKTQNLTGTTLGNNIEKPLLRFYQNVIDESK
jgi:hypothetical protein